MNYKDIYYNDTVYHLHSYKSMLNRVHICSLQEVWLVMHAYAYVHEFVSE
jgi:hypothetical protein